MLPIRDKSILRKFSNITCVIKYILSLTEAYKNIALEVNLSAKGEYVCETPLQNTTGTVIKIYNCNLIQNIHRNFLFKGILNYIVSELTSGFVNPGYSCSCS